MDAKDVCQVFHFHNSKVVESQTVKFITPKILLCAKSVYPTFNSKIDYVILETVYKQILTLQNVSDANKDI